MTFTVYQTIHIHMLKIGSINNSSVVQIGSTGSIQAQADIHNTGHFTTLAKPAYDDTLTLEPDITTLIPLAPTP